MKRVLVTGGSGFIGRFLCKELLTNGYEVIVFDPHREKSEFLDVRKVEGDILDASLLRNAAQGIDIIFHLAGVLGTDYLCGRVAEAIRVNILGMVNVLEVARDLRAKVINTGVVADWDSPYMITKKAAMRLGRMYRREYGVDVVTLEITHVYGPGQALDPYHKAIPTFIVRALTETPLPVYGKGIKHMDCVYVTDIARAMRVAAETRGLDSVLTVTSNDPIRVVDLAKNIIKLTRSRSQIEFLPMRPGEPDDTREEKFAPVKATLLPGWRPQVPFTEGLAKTIDWYRKLLTET